MNQQRRTEWRTLLQLELLHTGLIGGDGGALDTDTVLLDGLGGINGNLVIGLVTVLETLAWRDVLAWYENASVINRVQGRLTKS